MTVTTSAGRSPVARLYNALMLRWSIWSREHLTLTREQRRLILGKWMTRGGIVHVIQIAVLSLFTMLVLDFIMLSALDSIAGFTPAFWMLVVVGFINLAALHQIIVRYIASEMRDEADRLGLRRDRVCAQCGYDLRGSPKGDCPECGCPRQ